ncbi:hypothetical protein C8R43DRAFT_638939, partial [Mycena crocata]
QTTLLSPPPSSILRLSLVAINNKPSPLHFRHRDEKGFKKLPMADLGLPPLEVEDLLLNNDVPTEVQTQKIQEFLTVAQDSLAGLHNLLDQPLEDATHAELILERDTLLDIIKCYTGTLSAVRRIPSEILCDVFALTLPHERNAYGGGTIPAPPWHLGWISRRWRAAAIGYGHLWTSIHIGTDEMQTDKLISHFYPLAAVETQLDRSTSCDLDITLSFGAHGWAPHLLALIDAVVLHSMRWASLTLHWKEETNPDLFRALSPIAGQLPNLRRLQLTRTTESADLPEDVRQLFVVAPQLRKIFLATIHYNSISPTTSAPWAQLTHLRACFGTHEYAYDILREAINLVEVGIEFESEGQWSDPGCFISFPHLRRLRVRETWILGFIEAPKLEYLFVYHGVHDVLPFLGRTGCQLLGLGTTSFYSLPVLRALPQLLHLHVSFIGAEVREFLVALTLSGGSADLCPHLISLRLSYSGKNARTHDALYAMVASRPSLESLQIYSYYSFPLSQQLKLEALQVAGLDLFISHCEDRQALPVRYPDMTPP